MEFDPDNPPIRLGPDNERHAINLFGDTACGLEDMYELNDDGELEDFELIDTGETDITCPDCLAD